MKRVLHLVRKEFLELRQDPRLFGIVILAPLLQLTMLGYAATTDVRDVPDRRRGRRPVRGKPGAHLTVRGLGDFAVIVDAVSLYGRSTATWTAVTRGWR